MSFDARCPCGTLTRHTHGLCDRCLAVEEAWLREGRNDTPDPFATAGR